VTRDQIYALIGAERIRQIEQWGKPHPWGWGDCSSDDVAPIVKAAVLTEEVGEVARAVLDQDPEQLQAELVQVATVAVAWLESL
jgi:NTP pyrophosphatase (non-canonical NTP hydrolase)